MDKHSYYIIVQEAIQRLRDNGLVCPEIKKEHIQVDKETGYPYYALDLDQDEEKLYHFCLRELDKVIDSMLGREEKPMPKTFGVYFDDNFTKDIPQIWYEKSKPIAEQNLEKFENPQFQEQEEEIKPTKEKEVLVKDLFDTFSTEDLPETYS